MRYYHHLTLTFIKSHNLDNVFNAKEHYLIPNEKTNFLPHFTHSSLSGATPVHGIPALTGFVHPFDRILVPNVTGPLHSSMQSDQGPQEVHSPFSLDRAIGKLQVNLKIF